jgi:hypothetical protein
MANLKAFRQVGDGRRSPTEAANEKQERVVGRQDAGAAGRVLGKPEEPPQGVAEAGQPPVVGLLEVPGTRSHKAQKYIAMRYKWKPA